MTMLEPDICRLCERQADACSTTNCDARNALLAIMRALKIKAAIVSCPQFKQKEESK